MKTRFPTSMVMLAAVVAVGMVGSQLGGLSGQAAGGESAGCGGDAYYDEDLGELVDSQGGVVDDAGEADASGSEEESPGLTVNFRPMLAGSAVPGNELVRILEPNAQAAADLAADSAGTVEFIARVDIDVDGRFAVIGWGASEPGYEDLSHLQILGNRENQWFMINELPADRDRATPLRNLSIVHVTSDDTIYLAIDQHGLLYDVARQRWAPSTPTAAANKLRQRYDNGLEARLANDEFEANLALKGDIANFLSSQDSDWTNELVDTVVGDARFSARTSMTNDLVIGTDASAALLVGACSYGDEPQMTESGVLVCDSCAAGTCFNPLNTLDVLELAPEQRQVLRIELRERVQAEIAPRLDEQRLELMVNPARVPAGFAEAIERGEKWSGGSASDTELWDISQGAYKGNSAPSGWTTWVECETDNAIAKFIYKYPTMTISFSGTDGLTDFGDWIDNFDTDHQTTNGITTHEGFYEYQDKVATCLNDHVALLDSWGIDIDYVVGHSLGGAAATVYSQTHTPGGELITFGAPKTRVGSSCTVGGQRFAHESDPVASNALGVMNSFNHDVSTAHKAYTEEVRGDCRWDTWFGCVRWYWHEDKTTVAQGCSAASGGCNFLVDCVYYFATVHLAYREYLD